ncbi:hypothetical protein ACJMK2_025967, partial [Sinanodonta woodiana]
KVKNLIQNISNFDLIALQEINNIQQEIINLIEDSCDSIFLTKKNPSEFVTG